MEALVSFLNLWGLTSLILVLGVVLLLGGIWLSFGNPWECDTPDEVIVIGDREEEDARDQG